MALKFCASLFSFEAFGLVPVTEAPSSAVLAAKLGAGAVDRKEVRSEILLAADDAKWEKEFRVHFDGSNGTGLGFQPLKPVAGSLRGSRRGSDSFVTVAARSSAASNDDSSQGDDYACVVREILPGGLAAEHNARCRSLGDYSRLVLPGLCVRRVNSDDVAGVPYDQVLLKLRDAMPAFFVTFADSVGGGAPGAALTPSSARRNSSVGLPFTPGGFEAKSVLRRVARRASSIVLLHSGATGTGDEALIDDLEAKSKDASDELQRVKQQMLELQRERERVALEKQQLVLERDALAAAKATLEADQLRLLEERDAAVTGNRLLASQHQSAGDHEEREASRLRDELDAAQDVLAQLQREHETAQAAIERRLGDHVRQSDDHATRVTQLQHEKDALQLAWTELQLEHVDATQHVEELHARLVHAQEQLTAAAKQLASAQDELADKTAQLSALTHGIQSIVSGTTTNALAHGSQLPDTVATLSAQQQQLVSLRQAQDERLATEKHRDELLLEASRCEQLLQCSQHEAEELAAANAALRGEVAALHAAIESAQLQQCEQQAAAEGQRLATHALAAQTRDELQRQIETLAARCDAERSGKQQLRLALDALEASARAKLDAHTRELEFLARFKQQLVRGVVVTKHGARGSPHARVVFADLGCRWLSWKPPTGGGALASPRADAAVETRDFVEVLAGAATDVFQRHRPADPAACLSLVFVRPCRTLDLEAESVDQCRELLRGFRLLLEDAAAQRHSER
ncbi:hypothetical protein PybrP1_002144 [[Pythium] brassicae (nom. inval.)]|nr:hypothetical protein PybrP1_002144 [[Pythium] brassicae (nom. inval.)]